MVWEPRGKNKKEYFYRSVRVGDRVRKKYFGAGPIGRIAARAEALRRAERKAQQEKWQAALMDLDAAEEQLGTLEDGCELLMAATLHSLGFHKPTRHAWRRWRNGQKALKGEF